MAGSRAVSGREPGQIREEAALSDTAHAPRISLAGAEDRRARPRARLDDGCTVQFQTATMASTSTSAPRGSAAAWMATRAGGSSPKNSPYTSFTRAKSPMSVR